MDGDLVLWVTRSMIRYERLQLHGSRPHGDAVVGRARGNARNGASIHDRVVPRGIESLSCCAATGDPVAQLVEQRTFNP